MSSSSHRPAGYCPHCGYPIDPGRCPECGEIVTPFRLARESPNLRRRRNRRRLAVLLVAAVLFGSGYYVWHRVNWIAFTPTSLLLTFQGDAYSRSAIELFRRYNAGELTADQARRMFDQAVGPPSLVLRPSVPANAEFLGCLRPDFNIPGGGSYGQGWDVLKVDWAVAVDGHVVAQHEGPGWSGFSTGNDLGIGQRIPPLEPGVHEITCSYTLILMPSKQVGRRNPKVLHTWRLTASATISVEDRPAEEFVTAVSSPELSATIRKNLHFPSSWSMFNAAGGVPYDYKDLPVAVIGDVWARPSGEGSYQRIGEFHAQSVLGMGEFIELHNLQGARGVTHLDIRIVPGAKLALRLGVDRYFADIIEVDHVPVFPRSGIWDPELAKEASPLRIVPMPDNPAEALTSAPTTSPTSRP